MNDSPTQLQVLETLVEELLKDSPEEPLVRDYMSRAGLTDTRDPIDRINKVLHALHFGEREKGFKE